MLLTQLELVNVLNCQQLVINFPLVARDTYVYICCGMDKCKVVSIGTQLICSHRFTTAESLEALQPILKEGRVTLSFMVPIDENLFHEICDEIEEDPCTSRQAIEREERRRLNEETGLCFVKVTATRDFRNSNIITYKINDVGNNHCYIAEFQFRFFSCTDIILPQLHNIAYGEYCNGNWINLLAYNFIYGERGENDLLETFSLLYAEGRIPRQDKLIMDLTTSVLQTRLSLRVARMSNLLLLFNDVRKIFEYISCEEYTVWFFLMNDEGGFEDIDIGAGVINFQRMKTIVELRNSSDENYARMCWTKAENYVQELLLVAIQLAFGARCKQSIIYLHSMEALMQIEAYERVNKTLEVVEGGDSDLKNGEKNYLERIVEMCIDLHLTAIMEFDTGIIIAPPNSVLYNCRWRSEYSSWEILMVDKVKINRCLVDQFVQAVKKTAAARSRSNDLQEDYD